METILNIKISREISMEQCLYQPWSVVTAILLRGWADQPGNPNRIPDLKGSATLKDWLDWAAQRDRGVRASTLEWVLMDPARGKVFCENITKSTVFRSKFGVLFVPITAALERLGAKDIAIPAFIGQGLGGP